MDAMPMEWKNKIPAIDKDSRMRIILFADDQVLTSEMNLQAAVHRFYSIMNLYNLKISIQ
jgi:hypothetical protein